MPQDPLDSIFGAVPRPSARGSDPLDNIFGPIGIDTTTKDNVSEEENIRRVVAKLRAIKPANEAHKKRIEQLIDKYETHGHNVASNLLRGTAAGVVRAIPQIASWLNQISGQEDPERERIRKINEFFDQGGTAGKVGGFIGEVIGSGPFYGKVVTSTAKGLAQISPTAGRFIAAAARPGASLARHAAVNVLTGIPINIAQGLGTYEIPVPADATEQEKDEIESLNRKNKLLNVGIGIVADALFGAAAEGAHRGLQRFGKAPAAVPPGTPPGDVPPALPAEREAALQAAKLKREAAEAKATVANKLRKLAQAEWTLAHPDQNWKDLKAEEKRTVIDTYKERVARDQAIQAAQLTPGVGAEQAPGAPPAGVSVDEIAARQNLEQFAAEGGGQYTGSTSGVGGIKLPPVDDFGRPLAPEVQQAISAAEASRGAAATDLLTPRANSEPVPIRIARAFDTWKDAQDALGEALKATKLTEKDFDRAKKFVLANPNLDKPPMTDAEIQAHADAGFNEAEANRPPVEMTPEMLAKQKEYDDIIALEEALATVQERGGLQNEEQWNSFIEDVNLLKKQNLTEDQMRAEMQSLIVDYTPPEALRPEPQDVVKELNSLMTQLTGEGDNPEVAAKAQRLYDSLIKDHGLTDEQIAELQAKAAEGKFQSMPIPGSLWQLLAPQPSLPYLPNLLARHGINETRWQNDLTNLQSADPIGPSFTPDIVGTTGYLSVGSSIPETTHGVYAGTPNVPKEVVDKIAAASYVPALTQAVSHAVSQARVAMAKVFTSPDVVPDAYFGGLVLEPNTIGVNTPRALLKFWHKHIPSYRFTGNANVIFYNPFEQMRELQNLPGYPYGKRAFTKNELVSDLTDQSVGTIVHESIHDMILGHSDDFSAVLTRALGTATRLIQESGARAEIEKAWRDIVYTDHKEFNEHFQLLRKAWQEGERNPGEPGYSSRNVAFRNEARSESGVPEETPPRTDGTGPEGGRDDLRAETTDVGREGNTAADAERAALVAELARTPLAQRGPILDKIKALSKVTKGVVKGEAKSLLVNQNPPSTTTNPPPIPTLGAAPAITPGGTFLESVPVRKSIEEMTVQELGAVDDRVAGLIEDDATSQAVKDAAIRDLNAIANYRIANATPYERPPLPPERVVDPNVTGAAREERIVPEEAPPSPDEEARKALRTKMMRGMRRLSDDEIKTAIADLESESHQIKVEIQDTADKAAALRAQAALAEEKEAKLLLKQAQRMETSSVALRDQLAATKQTLDKVFAERADRFLGTGLRAQIPPTIGGGTAGFIGGLFLPAENEEERMNHAWIGLAAGLAGGAGLGRYQKMVRGRVDVERPVSELPGGAWQQEMQKYVITGQPKASRNMPFLERMRHIYWNTIRRSYVGERLGEALDANRLATASNPGRQLSMFGRWSAMTESTLRDGPSIVDEFGNPKHLLTDAGTPVPGVHEIITDVNGDVETLGILAAARTKIELGDAVKTPFDTVLAENIYRTIPEIFHKAADKLRQLSLGMADVAVWGGLLSKDARALFSHETMYAPLMRIFKFESLAKAINTEDIQNKIARAANPLKRRQGGANAPIKNPAESVFEMIPRIHRAAELNRIKESFLTAWEAADKPDVGIRRLSKGDLPPNPEHDILVQAVKSQMGLKDPDAHALVTALDPKSVDVERGIMRIFRNGIVESYQIPPELARTILSLTPDEMSLLLKMAGLPARIPATGIVYNPFFIAKMAFFDMFQATANSEYGFRFGIDNIRGYLNIVTRSKKYQDLLATGLSHQALAGGNLENIKTTTEALRQTAGSPMQVAIRHLKEGRPIEFYKSIVAPIADAARVGEALRALDRGASYLDAVYAAKNVVGNYAEIGAWQGMRALQHMTMFLGPALQVLDTAAYRSGIHPFRVSDAGRFKDFTRYFWKMGSAIAIPSALLWYKAESENDDEIRQMRTSEFGRRWWFYRLNWDVPGFGKAGEIVKIPKPILDGQLFGTAIELTLDRLKGENPTAVDELIKGAGADAAFNFLPAIGVVPFALAFNKDPSTGWNIEPEGQQDIAPEHRGEANASWLSRNISRSLAPKFEGVNWPIIQRSLSPAGIDYLFNAVGGMLGRDAVIAISAALEYEDTGYIPAKQEWPVIRQVFAQVPTRQTHDIQEFYRHADEVEQVSRTIAHMIKADPGRVIEYMARHENEYQVAPAYAKARTQIAAYRRAIADLRELSTDVVSSEDRRRMTAEYIRAMNQVAAEVNDVTRPWFK